MQENNEAATHEMGKTWFERTLVFLKVRPTLEKVLSLGTAQNPTNADIINLKPNDSNIYSIDVFMDNNESTPSVMSVRFNINKDMGLNFENLKSILGDGDFTDNPYDFEKMGEFHDGKLKIQAYTRYDEKDQISLIDFIYF